MTLILLASYSYALFWQVPEAETYTNAEFFITDKKRITTPFSQGTVAHGIVYAAGHTPTKAHLFLKKKFPKGERLFFETLTRTQTRLQGTPTSATKAPHSLVPLRYSLKYKVISYIRKHYPRFFPRAFLQTVCTGFSQSARIDAHFARCGLSHLLAVSGFHFTLILGSLYWLLRRRISVPHAALCVAVCAVFLKLYFGEAASILRAYEMALLLFFGLGIARSPRGGNLLGIAATCALLNNPLALQELGFQLSYAATYALLVLFPLIRRFVHKWLHVVPPPMTASYPVKIRALSARTCLDMILATTVPTLVTLPIILTWFHTAPLATFLYNLFLPPLIAISLLIFLVGICFPPIHAMNTVLLDWILIPVSYQPAWTMGVLSASFPTWLAVYSLFLAITSPYLIAALWNRKTSFSPSPSDSTLTKRPHHGLLVAHRETPVFQVWRS